MMEHKKPSFGIFITMVCLGSLLVATFSLSFLAIVNYRDAIYKQVQAKTTEQVAHIQERVIDQFREWSKLISYVAIAASPFMAAEPPDTRTLQSLFKRFMDAQTDIWHIYGTNNLVWNKPGGYVVYGNGGMPNDTWDNTTRNWFIGAKQNPGKVSYADPYIAESNGQLTTAISTNVYDEQRQDVGVVSGNVSISFLDELLRESTFMSGQEMFFINHEGLFITHSDPEAVLQKDFFKESGLESYRNIILNSSQYSSLDKQWFLISAQIPEVNWIFISKIPQQAIFAEVQRLLFRMILISSILFILTAGVSLFCTRIIIKPFKYLKAYSASIAGGDFSGTVPDYGTAEASGLSTGFNAINEHISALIKNVTSSFQRIRANGTELEQLIDQSSAAATEIVYAIHDVDQRIKEEAGMVGKTVTRIDDEILSLNTLLQKQAAQISSSSAAIEAMIVHNQDIEAQITGLNAQILQLVDSSKTEHSHIARSTNAVNQIGEDSAHLAQMNKIIGTVAHETNLLAMNAAIEAAHAGDSGKGFAVVSGEIRKLAETTAAQAKGSSGALTQIQKRIMEITAASSRIEGAYSQTNELIQRSHDVVEKVKAAIGEQSTRSEQVLQSLKELQGITGQVKNEAEHIKEAADLSRQMSGKMSAMSEAIQTRVSEVVKSTELVFAASQRAHGSVKENGKGLDALDEAIQRFTVRKE
ncbi:MAG: methyl-accepting chemotaxis protein [Treponema sp.]|jgi:methyl-accepting chemotaxis protein|nr:methyl-accepting chemotaxis protein [Treponema sp.]